ncbi:AbrB/MazE/SpoVT family DNA-binding domain-containing protein [Nonomuraea turcica]|uniref:AbrB/MazE/SpoVT family DNA-binding domain-containing protein n=1 Tax=Nonomuraea sp. G32 TaxID=3067274 RepID=UPI00273C7C72|nr:AbrB/MazE/SpoVT family DNA-binding domain-containing protein [Nonomuraea sp. G32]MDP4504011.1 AbrB/MazE/SpoVT family DNA-binding domain-containing protein [Nonomuraea sp. G32]
MASNESKPFYGPGGRGFYGAVTVSERGQIAIPAQARRDLGIRPGDKLLVLGDPQQGLALMSIEHLMRNLQGSSALLEQIQKHALGDTEETEPEE